LIKSGRLPISAKNIEFIAQSPDRDRKTIINERSIDADLTILGFQGMVLKHQKEKLFNGFDQIGNVLFVNATHEIDIVEPEEAAVAHVEEGEPEPASATGSAAVAAEPPSDPDTSKTSRG
jgi:hypothetical protein